MFAQTLRLLPLTLFFTVACTSKSDGGADTGGADGVDGADGSDGADGTDGADGADGSDGADGADGSDGADGTDGSDGADGTDGADGSDGTDGADGGDGGDGGGTAIAAGTYTGGMTINALVPELGLSDSCTGSGTMTVGADGAVALVANCSGFVYISGTAEITGSGAMVSDLEGEGSLSATDYFGSTPFVLDFAAGAAPMDFLLTAAPTGTLSGYSFGATLEFRSEAMFDGP